MTFLVKSKFRISFGNDYDYDADATYPYGCTGPVLVLMSYLVIRPEVLKYDYDKTAK